MKCIIFGFCVPNTEIKCDNAHTDPREAVERSSLKAAANPLALREKLL